MKKKQRPLFGVTEFFNDDSLPKKNYISYVYIQEESGDFNRVLYGRNRLAKRILEKRRRSNSLSKAQGSKIGLLKKEEERKIRRFQAAFKKGQQKMRKYVQGKSVYTEKQLAAFT